MPAINNAPHYELQYAFKKQGGDELLNTKNSVSIMVHVVQVGDSIGLDEHLATAAVNPRPRNVGALLRTDLGSAYRSI